MKSSDNSARTFQKKKLLAFSTLKNDLLLLLYTQKHTETNPSKFKRWWWNYIINTVAYNIEKPTVSRGFT